jgi:hypothetical protein
MKTAMVLAAALVGLASGLTAQETRPVPKDSVRVMIPGCTKGYVFTAGRRTVEEPGSADFPVGTHFRMNGPKKLIAEIKAHEGSMIEITGLMKRGQNINDGVRVGGGIRVLPGSGGGSVSGPVTPGGGQIFLDVESWRRVDGSCPSR